MLLAAPALAEVRTFAPPAEATPPPADDTPAEGTADDDQPEAEAAARAAASAVAATGSRSAENAVRQAGDAFGSTIGREVIGIYNQMNVRGFSPIAAGNVRIDGLYFDNVVPPTNRI
ncbi:MAG: hypothetical protein WCO82_01685, partial [Sphingomonadales bacterium]